MAVSLYHQSNNLNRARVRELTGQPEPATPPAPRPPLRDWLLAGSTATSEPEDQLDSLPGVLWHLSDAWQRREASNVVLVHYDDLLADLDGEMRRIAALLGITVPEDMWPDLVAAATFDSMRDRAQRTAPDPSGILKDTAAFFRRGTSGAGLEVLTADEVAHYRARTAALAPPDLLDLVAPRAAQRLVDVEVDGERAVVAHAEPHTCTSRTADSSMPSASTWSNCTRGRHDGYVAARASCAHRVVSRGSAPGRLKSPISNRGPGSRAPSARAPAAGRRSSRARTTGERSRP